MNTLNNALIMEFESLMAKQNELEAVNDYINYCLDLQFRTTDLNDATIKIMRLSTGQFLTPMTVLDVLSKHGKIIDRRKSA